MPSVTGANAAHELKGAETSPLVVAVPLQGLDKSSVLAVTERFGVEAEVHVHGAGMGHFSFL